MTKEQLLKPRYKVIADYPESIWEVGKILDRDWGWNGDDETGFKNHISHYPHLFRKLDWWEDREPGDMPEYVKDLKTNKIFKVADESQDFRIWHTEGEIEFRFIKNSGYEPATEEEYNAYKAGVTA